LTRANPIEPLHTRRLAKDGAVIAVSIVTSALLDKHGNVYAVATTERMVGAQAK
jgi:two-component system CheB/CheR fusion protein